MAEEAMMRRMITFFWWSSGATSPLSLAQVKKAKQSSSYKVRAFHAPCSLSSFGEELWCICRAPHTCM